MKGFALILGFLALEAAFLWHAAAPQAVTPGLAPAPAFARGAVEERPAASGAAVGEDAPCETRLFVVRGRPADLVPGFSL